MTHGNVFQNKYISVTFCSLSITNICFSEMSIFVFFQHNSGDESEEPSGQSSVMSTSLHPVVFRWHGEGQKVFLSGSFDGWERKIPLVRRCCLHCWHI